MIDNSSDNNISNIKKIRRNKKTFYSNERENILQQLQAIIPLILILYSIKIIY